MDLGAGTWDLGAGGPGTWALDSLVWEQGAGGREQAGVRGQGGTFFIDFSPYPKTGVLVIPHILRFGFLLLVHQVL